MYFNEILAGIDLLHRSGPNPVIGGVEYDSRRVSQGSLFVAMKGGSVDGNRFVDAAIAAGAAAIVSDSAEAIALFEAKYPDIAFACIGHGRNALAALASNFFGHPERQLSLVGVTGTNGKTTTAFLTEALLNSVNRKTVLVGTIEYHVCGEVYSSPHTTPESRDLFDLMAKGVSQGASELVMEVSSHALDQGRVAGLQFDVAIFTNLTQDHLDYHGTMENYFAAKCKLFDGSALPAPRVAVINADDPYSNRLIATAVAAGVQVWTYGIQSGDFHATQIKMSATGMRFRMTTPSGEVEMQTRLTGRVNVYNLLAASAASFARGVSLSQIASSARMLPYVPGRFQAVIGTQPFPVIVDYAHTDDALKNLLMLARDFVAPKSGRVITVFGCGGDRDKTKRPRMGRVAGERSDFVIATSDNPRSENPLAILEDIRPGLEAAGASFIAEPDRAQAIRLALKEAQPDDIVLIAGKGHEKVQVLADHTIDFDDVSVAELALEEMGYGSKQA